MPLFLGIDGGQSSTTALLGDETGRVLGIGRGGPCNHVKAGNGHEKFSQAINFALVSVAQQAGLSASSLAYESVCAGFSGGPADKQELLRQLVPTSNLTVTHDALIALVGATAGQPGVIVIAGTGSIAFGRNRLGQTARAGGWGYIFGDEGGAFDLTRQALRSALRMEEGWGPYTSLRAQLLKATGALTANDLLHQFYTPQFSRPQIASLAHIVDIEALQGDAVARELLSQAAQQLAALSGCVRQQLFASEDTVVCPIGGVYRSQYLRERFATLIELTAGSRVQLPQYGPAAGALLEAYRIAGRNVTLSHIPEEKADT